MPATTPLTARDLNRATLARQGLLEPMTGSPATLVERAGSLQAQHPEWPPVALAARAADAASADLAGALDRRDVVRSSLMRITIHVVTAADLWPMYAVCQAMRLSQWKLLAKADPIDSPLGRRMRAAGKIAVAALAERPRSSTELDRLMAAQVGPVDTPVQRIYWRHLAAVVPMVHVPHDREGYGRSRYAVATEWLGTPQPKIDLAEARKHVARRYLAAFGPASLEDLVAYVGRGRGGSGVWRDTLAALDGELVVLRTDEGRTVYDLADAPRPDPDTPAAPRLLARWDSALLSHASKARQRIIGDANRPAVFSKNADVLPTFLVDGFVAGTWELSRSDGEVALVLQPFGRLSRAVAEQLVAEAERVLSLLEPRASRRVEIRRRAG